MIKEQLETMKESLKIQGYDGNWNYDEYMFGMYNGMELMMAIAEKREPVFKEKPTKFIDEKHKLIDFDWLITNGMPLHDMSITGRLEKGWKVIATVPAKLIHPSSCNTDMATIFTKYTPYPKDENEIAESSCLNLEVNHV